MEWVVPTALFVLGACVGSFLNVVILRYGFSERGGERSHCAACTATLHVTDLVPIVSYVYLSGRCRHCGSAIQLQYPFVEVLVGLLFLVTYAVLPTDTIAEQLLMVSFFGFWTALVGLVVYDVRHTLIPLPFLYFLGAFVILGNVSMALTLGFPAVLANAFGALACGGFFALIHFVTRGKGMGLGDAYVAFLIGGMLGLSSGVFASAVGVWSGALVGVCLLALSRAFPHSGVRVGTKRVTLKTEIPFAPFLAIGAIAAFVLGPNVPNLAKLFI